MGGLFYLGKLDSSKKKKKTKEAGVEHWWHKFPYNGGTGWGGGRLVMAVSVKIGSTTDPSAWGYRTVSPPELPVFLSSTANVPLLPWKSPDKNSVGSSETRALIKKDTNTFQNIVQETS